MEYKEKTKNIEIRFLNELIREISYMMMERMYIDAKADVYYNEYDIRDFVDMDELIKKVIEYKKHVPIFDEFMRMLGDATILFSTEDTEYSWISYKGKFIININYRYLKTLKGLLAWIKKANKEKESNFMTKYMNNRSFRDLVRIIIGKKPYDVSTFAKYLKTNDDKHYRVFVEEIVTIIGHEMRHMFDKINQKSEYANDSDSDLYYSDREEYKYLYLKLQHEVDARAQTALYQLEPKIKNIHKFEDFSKLFIKAYGDDYKALNQELIKYLNEQILMFWKNIRHSKKSNYEKQLNEKYMEHQEHEQIELILKCVDFICNELGIDVPTIKLLLDVDYAKNNSSFASYSPTNKEIQCVIINRSVADSIRSIAHELMHYKQDLDGVLTDIAGEDGDVFENEANSFSGRMMRIIGREFPLVYELFDENRQSALNESVKIVKKKQRIRVSQSFLEKNLIRL